MPHRRHALLAALVALAPWGCRRGGPQDAAPPTAPAANDAARLPAFDITSGTPPTSARGVPYERFYVDVTGAPFRGPAEAPVTIVMFSDFECPFCSRGHQVMQELLQRYPGKVRVVYKAYPLDIHENAFDAAMAAHAAQRDGRFWEFHDRLFSGRGLDRAAILDHARATGIDTAALSKDLDELAYLVPVAQDLRQGRRLGVSSTPTFFVNGRLVKGAQPLDAFVQVVEQELALARTWLTEGVAAGGIYAHAIADGFRRVEYRDRRSLDPDGVFPVPVGDSPTKGPATALVTIVVFGDFECPFCSRGFDTLEKISARYGDALRIVYKHQPLPFHSHAFLAARASVAAHAQGKFWPFHDALYRRGAKFDEETLRAIAREVGLDRRKFDKALDSTELDAAIAADQRLAAALGVRGTPAYFVNGRPLEGAQPELSFRLLVEEELQRARALLAEGVAPKDLYDTLLRRPLE